MPNVYSKFLVVDPLIIKQTAQELHLPCALKYYKTQPKDIDWQKLFMSDLLFDTTKNLGYRQSIPIRM